MFSQGLANQRANRQVRHVMIVHDIEMNDVCTRGEDVIDFFAEPRKIG
jgi:hypothetical protein